MVRTAAGPPLKNAIPYQHVVRAMNQHRQRPGQCASCSLPGIDPGLQSTAVICRQGHRGWTACPPRAKVGGYSHRRGSPAISNIGENWPMGRLSVHSSPQPEVWTGGRGAEKCPKPGLLAETGSGSREKQHFLPREADRAEATLPVKPARSGFL